MDKLNQIYYESQQIEETQKEKSLGKNYRVYFEGRFLKYVRALTPIVAVCKVAVLKDIHSDNPELREVGNGTFQSRNGFNYEVK